MSRGMALIALSFALSPAVAQSQPSSSSNSQAEAPKGSSEPSSPQARSDTRPRALYAPDPAYPAKGRNGLKGGLVVLRLTIGSDGRPHDIKVGRSLSPGFDEAAINAVKKWKFAPATKVGKPVSLQTTVQVAFRTQ